MHEVLSQQINRNFFVTEQALMYKHADVHNWLCMHTYVL